jgi:hypothetical protein
MEMTGIALMAEVLLQEFSPSQVGDLMFDLLAEDGWSLSEISRVATLEDIPTAVRSQLDERCQSADIVLAYAS